MPRIKASKRVQRRSLDRSIDLEIEQLGRSLKDSWVLILLVILAALFFSSVIHLPGVDSNTVLAYIFQIAFTIVFVIILFAASFRFLGRLRTYWVLPGETGVTFKDYKGNPEVLEAARRITTLIGGNEDFQKLGAQSVRGLLLTGAPGTGKSYLAKCMSAEAGVPFGYVSVASLQSMFMGMNVLIIMRLYGKARRYAREYGGCVLFLDEIDLIGGAHSSGISSGGLNQLLMEMDPFSAETGWFKKILRPLGFYRGHVRHPLVLTIGATNVPEALDRVLLRPGCFDRKINVAPPTDKYRPEVIQYYLNKVQYAAGISLTTVSARMVEYTPVVIKHVINEAVIIAYFDGRDKISYQDLVKAQDIYEYGSHQLSELTLVERRRLAYHEAGHTVACYYLMDRYFPAFVTLHLHDGDLEGAAAWRPRETIITSTREDILARIQVSLASRAAEELFLNTQLSCVTDDFASATRLAAMYIGAYGMDNTLFSLRAFVDFTGGLGALMGNQQIMERIEELLQSQLRAVKQLFLVHNEAVIMLAEALIERDELVAEEIKEIIDNADTHTAAKKILSEYQPLLEAENNGNGHYSVVVPTNGSKE